ncbi:MAG TPA: glycosyltransferase family 2 protein [Solirubrobacterales bacterium]|nr:glycosyltransferase family 2 protein [Solirubrobacterales bacterium]
MRLRASYALPLLWTEPGPIEELATYLARVAQEVEEVIVIDGSPPPLYQRHAELLGANARHLPPDPDLAFQMGKVNGVITALRNCTQEWVVIADDDVRYGPTALRRAVELLGEADLVRPQNFFDPLPWHARWDTARSLLNRVFTGDPEFPVGDFPGTLAVRRSSFFAAGAYDGDALFENLELMRTIRAGGGRVITPLDLHVGRRPPSTEHFLSQRVRQAYDDFAIPARLGAWLAIWPSLLAPGRRRRRVAIAAATSVALAEVGRRRAGGTTVFPVSGSLLAPAWLLERGTCAWLALGARLRGGVRYGRGRIRQAATPSRALRRRYVESPRGSAAGPGDASLSARNPIAL